MRAAVFMDQREDCDRAITQTQDLVEGDVFLVKSDVHGGKETDENERQPAECSVKFNFGDRRVVVVVDKWTCDEPHREPTLAIYDDCDGQRKSKPLVCSASTPFLHYYRARQKLDKAVAQNFVH